MRTKQEIKQYSWGASWFFFIALYSLANYLGFLFHLPIFYNQGLGVAKIISFWSADVGGLRWNLFIASFPVWYILFFVLLGFAAKKGYKQALSAGALIYFCDGLILLVQGENRLILIHIFVLYKLLKIYLIGLKYHTSLPLQTLSLWTKKGILAISIFVLFLLSLIWVLFLQKPKTRQCMADRVKSNLFYGNSGIYSELNDCIPVGSSQEYMLEQMKNIGFRCAVASDTSVSCIYKAERNVYGQTIWHVDFQILQNKVKSFEEYGEYL